MGPSLSLQIERWAAWAPGLQTAAEWRSWLRSPAPLDSPAAPKLQALPPMLRRRTSQLGRMCLETALRCASLEECRSLRSVFGSRHGESQTTEELLKSLAQDEVLSPLAFSLSVHNASSGVFTIVGKNNAPSCAVAAGPETFFYTLLEGALQSAAHPAERVLVIMSDELVSATFKPVVNEPLLPYACAFLLGPAGTPLQLGFRHEASLPPFCACYPPAADFLNWLFSEAPSLDYRARCRSWSFSAEGGALAKRFVDPG